MKTYPNKPSSASDARVSCRVSTPRVRGLVGLGLSAVLTLTLTASPVQAGVIDQVKSRVDAIKSDTSVLKSKSNQVLLRLDETASTVNSVIAETDLIKQAMEPLENVRALKHKLTQFNFDPAELLENPALAEAIAKVKASKAQVDALINDPDVENFRADLLLLLEQVKLLAYDGPEFGSDLNTPEPIVTLVENAPPMVIALLKMALAESLQPMQTLMSGLSSAKTTLAPLMQDIALGTSFCAPYAANPEAIWVNAMRGQKQANMVHKLLSKAGEKLPELPPQEIGIHGYFSFEVDVSEETGEKLEKLAGVFEGLAEQFELVREIADHCAG